MNNTTTPEHFLKQSFYNDKSLRFSGLDFYEVKGESGYDWIYEAMEAYANSKEMKAAENGFGEGYSAGHDQVNEEEYEARKEQFLSQYDKPHQL